MLNNNFNPFNFWNPSSAPANAHNPFMDPGVLISSMSGALQKIMSDPDKRKDVQKSLQSCTEVLSKYIIKRMGGEFAEPPIALASRDKRFNHDHWESNIFFDIMKQSYLVFSDWFEKTLNDDELDLDPEEKKQLRFYAQQITHSMSPNNFAFLNPSVIEEAQKTGGASVMKGFITMMEDLHKGKDPDMTDMNHFKIGENIALSKGSVVFRNDLIELMQYNPTTQDVFQTPMLIVPPWINKYYVFDLSPEKSMVQWLLDQGRTVFIISWVNPDIAHRYKTIESYILEGPKAAIEVIQKITDVEKVDAMGYCLGGTLLVCVASYFAAVKRSDIASLTLLTTLTDFSDAGDLTAFASEEYVQKIEKLMSDKGYLSGKIMARTFNMMRPSELVWSYVVNNYYMGKDPVPFDFLYWNSDNTNMPEAMHSNLLRFFYQQNRLTQPGRYKVNGEGIDLSNIDLPIYMMSTKDDHIAPWKATYSGVSLMKNAKLQFVLGGSGHVAGVINSPVKEKYGYWLNKNLTASADEWQAGAEEHAGSWWIHWHQWLSGLGGAKVAARSVGSVEYPALSEAPGEYVLKSCE
ncbi:PHA/PHB synthase family protein [Candidatus Bodocaedibacter vickermanii]|uniref:Poly(3-hydroxyalkanoate) polymerase subunit PhaC n=1 Tax=Candidatus Bodocaedibacter vickermanii TaxID=2741701 RepID=A0A7L9RTW0_9PROT|nr:Poly(3-hydroxyalkanoate) polymerase subunit PhaC [Candidatus Paracaedibacteraceae bacterium 'Lake Konstanz']